MKKKPRSRKSVPQSTVHVVADFDYDKLAAAIVKAQQKQSQTKAKPAPLEKITVWKF